MKRVLILSSVLTIALCSLIGCDSKVGGDVDSSDQKSNVPNEIVKRDMNNYIDPAQEVYK